FVRVDFNNPNTVYHTFFRVANDPNADTFMQRSDDAGATWTNITAGIATTDISLFYTPYVMDPNNPARLVLGTDHLYETTNKGANWTVRSTPTTAGWTTSSVITAVALAKTDSQFIYAAAGGHIFVTTNDGATWSQRDIPNATDDIKGLLVDPTNSLVVYAVRD